MHHYLTAEVSRGAVAHNLKVVRQRIPAGCKICGVVKANCYGHGLAGLLNTIASATDWLAVATVAEALEVRRHGYTGPLMILMALAPQVGDWQADACAEAINADVQLAVTDPADVLAIDRLAARQNKQAAVQVKLDTGMGRSGALPALAHAVVKAIRSANSLRLAGVFSHLAASDEPDKTHAHAQVGLFKELLAELETTSGVVASIANSAAICDLMPDAAIDMVRPGLAMYGYQPGEELLHTLPLQPCLRLTGPIIQIKRLPAGSTCGYACTCKLARDSRVGIVPAGYADGLARSLSGHCPVSVRGQVAPVLGRISMDQIIIDLTDQPTVGLGETVELISPDPQAANSVQNIARLSATIPYEVTCRLGKRIDFKAVDGFSSI